jgi:two-component system response regulator HydG
VNRRILVVDDDRTMVRTLCDIFRLRGWEPDGVYSGEEAIEAGNTVTYGAVLMDIKMGGIDGVTAFKAMKQRDPGARVVLMTAHTSPEVIEDAHRAGALEVMSKPVDLTSLMVLLESRE